MRKHLVHSCLIIVVLAGALGASPRTSGEQPPPAATVRVLSADGDGITLELTVSHVAIEPVTLAGQQYTP